MFLVKDRKLCLSVLYSKYIEFEVYMNIKADAV